MLLEDILESYPSTYSSAHAYRYRLTWVFHGATGLGGGGVEPQKVRILSRCEEQQRIQKVVHEEHCPRHYECSNAKQQTPSRSSSRCISGQTAAAMMMTGRCNYSSSNFDVVVVVQLGFWCSKLGDNVVFAETQASTALAICTTAADSGSVLT